MCECDWDPPAIMTTTVRKARKDHHCVECDNGIAKGDLYKLISGVWDGRGESFKQCHTCATIESLANGVHPGFCYAIGSMLETLEECVLAYEPGGRWAERAA